MSSYILDTLSVPQLDNIEYKKTIFSYIAIILAKKDNYIIYDQHHIFT